MPINIGVVCISNLPSYKSLYYLAHFEDLWGLPLDFVIHNNKYLAYSNTIYLLSFQFLASIFRT